MAVVPQIFDGLNGNRDVNTLSMMPHFGYTNNGLHKPALKLNWTKTTPLESPGCMRGSVLRTNLGGERGVNPCKGVAGNNLVGGGSHYVLRRPTIPYQGGLYPHQGYARGQRKGLAYDPQKPLNQPLAPKADSFNAGLNTKLPQPNYKVY